MQDQIASLLAHPKIWRGSAGKPGHDTRNIPPGYPFLADKLPGNGWPAGALTEIVSDGAGIGELRLIMPALAHLTGQGQWLAWIAPPYIPYAPALEQSGIMLSRTVVVQSTSMLESLWAAEQILRNKSTGAVLLWSYPADERKLRRLQLAAETGGSWEFYSPARRHHHHPPLYDCVSAHHPPARAAGQWCGCSSAVAASRAHSYGKSETKPQDKRPGFSATQGVFPQTAKGFFSTTGYRQVVSYPSASVWIGGFDRRCRGLYSLCGSRGQTKRLSSGL